MLSRTADHLYWMARYVERSEHLARMLDAHYRLSLLPRPQEAQLQGWHATLTSLGMSEEFQARHPNGGAAEAVHFLAFDRAHTGSILSCLGAARENARAVRGTITSELWETLNATYLEARGFRGDTGYMDVANFLDWVKYRSHLTRGVTVGTMLRDEAFRFASLGTFIERADGTTRLLEARWRDPGGEGERLATEASEWSVLLRALSAFEVYRKVYRESVTPWRVTEMLLLNPELPSSVHRCLRTMLSNLSAVGNDQSAETERQAGELQAQFRYGRLDDLCSDGVPQFLDRLQHKLNRLADRIAVDFLAAGHSG
jgi:uncharacterized alpha-E superfamily protein